MTKNIFRLAMLLVLSLGVASAVVAQSEQAYPVGSGALEIFDFDSMENVPQWVQVWMNIMMLSFVAGLLFVWKHVIARWVVAGFILGVVVGIGIAPQLGILPLSGFIALIHLIFWSPALYQLLTKRPFMGELSAYSVWTGIITAVILFSFIFDIRDAVIYLGHIL